ncbi:MAG: DUF2383 domain-containing protein [Caldilinea sp. CFX5]|nr:DUF2383 domain-containing protein [Caldilinea sp. CFX5]
MSQTLDVQSIIDQLILVNQESKRNFYTAAAQVENRATKLLLKAYAQERARFIRELQQSRPQPTAAVVESTPAPAGSFFHRGWLALKAALVIRRQRRHRLLLAELQQMETNTMDAYARVTTATLPAPLRTLVERQYERIRAVHRWVTLLSQQQERQVAVRLFNRWEEAEQAIGRLAQLGIARSELAIVSVDEVAAYANDQQARPRATREAIVTGGLLGLVAGGALGLIYGSFHRTIFPDVGGFLTSSPTGIMWEVALYGAVIGLIFALIFSTLIATSAAEMDTHLYEESFQQGDTLVAVSTDAANLRNVERVIGLKHEHEIAPMTA